MPIGVPSTANLYCYNFATKMNNFAALDPKFSARNSVAKKPSYWWRNSLASILGTIACFSPTTLHAQNVENLNAADLIEKFANVSVGSGEVILLSLFGGSMSFALMAAFWLIRERNRANDENTRLRHSLASHKAANERNEALIHVADQRVVLWAGTDDTPVVLGSLPPTSTSPAAKKEFLCFGKWVSPEYSKTFEKAVSGLRKNADAFDMPLKTVSGGIIEAQGRTSGSYAFIRFIELAGERAALAHLESEHSNLLSTFDSIQTLFDRLDMQVWLSKNNGNLYWANNAFARAVEADNSTNAIDGNISLFDKAERAKIQSGLESDGHFNDSLPAIISGDRRIVELIEVRGENGGAAIAIDKSDVERVNNALSETIAGHALTLNQLTTAIAIFDADRKLQFYNSSFSKLWKLDEEFLESNPSNAAILDAMRDSKRLPTQPDWRKWRESQLEIYQALEAREEWWHLPDSITLRVVVNPQNLGGATWIFEDVTEELALKSNYNSLIRVQGETLDHLSEAVAVFSSDGKLRLSNPAMWKLLHMENSDVKIGIHISELSNHLAEKIESTEVWEDIVGAITGFDEQRGGRIGRLYMQDEKILEFSLVPLPDGRVMLTLVDVTSNVNFEKALTQRNEALEEAGNLKNRFLQHVSYELRTPLTTISGFGELLTMEQTGSLNNVQSEYLENINTSSQVLKAIIDDILDLATIDAGAMELELSKFDIAPIISGVVENLATVLDKNHVTVKTDFSEENNELVADSTRFRQIIYNLVSNAIEHSPHGGVVTVTSKNKGGNTLISVADQGPGVAKEDREMIFSRFEGGNKGHARKGVGLGLSIVKSFMELHDGDIHIEDAPKKGARFVCEFPAEPSQIRQAAQ